MVVGKEFKYWGSGNSTSQGYYAEVDLAEFPQLESVARESLHHNEMAYQFLAAVASRRCYSQALKEGVIDQDQYDILLRPFKKALEFEKGLEKTNV